MASSYVNDLRLNEMATGDASGTWGDTTNTNLELIAEAFSYGTEAITTNADTHTTTIADGATDPGRSMFLKYTGTLDSTCTITIGPNTVSKLWIIENGTSGSQSIIIKQGSGATVTIPSGKTKAIYSDGAGSGGAMVDAFATLNLQTSGIIETSSSIQTPLIEFTDGDDAMTIADGGGVTFAQTATFSDDIIIGDGKTIGSASDVDAMTIAANGQVTFTQTLIGTALDISGDIDVDGTTNLDVVDIDGALTQDGGAVFNEASADVDFRVESNGNANMLFVDGGNNYVAMGASTDLTGVLNITHGAEFGLVTSGPFNFQAKFESTDAEAAIVIEDSNSGTDYNRIGVITNDMAFTTNNSERMRIDSSGHVMFGTTTVTPATTNVTGVSALNDGRFHVSAQSQTALFVNRKGTDGTAVEFRNDATIVGSISVASASTAYNTSSDARLKDIIGEARGLKVINELNPVSYNWKADGKSDEGLIAQEVKELVPNAVSQTDEGYYQMDYSKLVTPLIKAIQEQQTQIDALQSEINLLKGE